METLYYSKGISKKALIAKVVSIILSLAFCAFLFTEANATVKAGFSGGTYKGNGVWQYSQGEVDKYDEDTQTIFRLLAVCMMVSGVVEAVMLGVQMRSWTEIYQDSVKGEYMGKTVACKLSDITAVSVTFNEQIALTGPAGKIKLIVKEPQEVQGIIQELLFKKVAQ